MSKSKKLEISYPISSNELKDYLTTNVGLCPFFMGITCSQFSTEQYMGGKQLPPKNKSVTINVDELLDKKSVEQLLNRLDLSISEFEEYLSNLQNS